MSTKGNTQQMSKQLTNLRAENEKLRLEVAGYNCEHRAKVMAKLRDENERLQREKDARVYYQSIVYAVCSALDAIDGNSIACATGIVCGTLETPSAEVEDRMKRLVAEAAKEKEA